MTASGDQTAQLWDIQQSTKLAVFKGHSCSLKSVDFQYENLCKKFSNNTLCFSIGLLLLQMNRLTKFDVSFVVVFATGARDGNVMVWDIRCNKRDGYYKPVNTIHNCHSTLANTGTPQRSNRRGRRRSSSNVTRAVRNFHQTIYKE